MASESKKVDELQIQISSDARVAISQLNSLATALDNTAAAASRLASATGSLNSFASAISKIANADTQTAVSNIKSLNKALGGKNLQSKKVNVDIAVNGIDNIRKLQSLAMPKVGTINLKDTGITAYIHALRRLADVDMSKFDMSFFDEVSKAMNNIGQLGNIDKSITKFVSALTRLADVGYRMKTTAQWLPDFAQALEDTIRKLQGVGVISSDISIFIAALGKLASAGANAGKTATGMYDLTDAVVHFLNEVSKAPQPSANMANTIQGLGMLAIAGQNAGKAMANFSRSGNQAANMILGSLGTALKSFGHDLLWVLGTVLKLGGMGASALVSFMQKFHLIPSARSDVDRMALSFGNLLRAVLPFYGIRGVFDWLKESFGLGSSVVELQNVIDTAFGSIVNGYRDISGYIYNWSKDTIDAFGVSELAAQRYAGRIMSMFNSSGFDANEQMRDSAAKMTTDLVERAGDIASFYDISVDEAMTKMQSALAGMTRPMRALGVNMNVANLEAFALSQGINQSWQEMDQATQMAIRYAYMLDATKYAAGDFGRTSQSAANQVRLLQLNTQQLSATLGQGLVSAIAPVIGWLNSLIKMLIQAAVAFRTFMWTLFGKPLAAVRGLVDDTAGYLDDAAGAASDLGSAGGGAADGLGSAGKAAKDLKKQLTVLPFDQLNQLAKDTDSAGSGGSGGGGGGGGGIGGLGDLGDLGLMPDLGDAIADSPVINAINLWAAEIREAFQKQQWSKLGYVVAKGINKGFKYIYDALDWAKIKPVVVDGFITPFQTVINSMMDGIDWNLIGRTFGRGLNIIVYTLRAWINGFKWREYGADFAEGMNGFIDEIRPDQIGRLIADKFKAAWDFFGGWVRTFHFSDLGYALRDGVVAAIDELDPADMGASLGTFLNGISDTIIAFLKDGSVVESVSGAFSEFVNGFLNDFDSDKAHDAIELVVDSIGGALADTFRKMDKSELLGAIIDVLTGLPWGVIGTALAIKAAGLLAASLFGAFFKIAATEALTAALAGMSGLELAIGLGAITAAALVVGAITIGGIALDKWIQQKFPERTAEIKESAAKETAEGQMKNQHILNNAGMNGAGYNTQIMTVPQTAPTPSAAPSPQASASPLDLFATIKTTLSGVIDPSFIKMDNARAAVIDTPVAQQLMSGKLTPDWLKSSKSWFGIFDMTATKKLAGQETSGYKSTRSTWLSWISQTILKTANGSATSGYTSTRKNWFDWISQTVLKTANGTRTSAYNSTRTNWFDWVAQTVLKTANGKGTSAYWDVSDNYYGLKDKWITAHFDVESSVRSITADLANGASEVVARFITNYNAAGGLFTGATGFQVFGEAGAEAAIPLERKSTMKRIASAIVDSGGMGTSNSDDIADAVAERLAPIIMSAMNGQNNRPINVNATLYTENNEVLARAVNQGNRSLDKRYNPVSQYSY